MERLSDEFIERLESAVQDAWQGLRLLSSATETFSELLDEMEHRRKHSTIELKSIKYGVQDE